MKKNILKKDRDLKRLTKSILKFRQERDWKQFHTPKDSAIALLSEATEVLDQFKWLNEKETNEYTKNIKRKSATSCQMFFFGLFLWRMT